MYDNYLSHHGILGQKWGVRRYQNADGSLTAAGKKRYDSGKKIRGLDEGALHRYEKNADPNKYGRLTEEQKKKYDWDKRLELQDKIHERADALMNNKELWNKWATKDANERYDSNPEQYKQWYGSKENFVKSYLDRDDNDGVSVWENYSSHDPKTRALIEKGKKWIDNVIEKEAATGVRRGEVYEQFMEEWLDGPSRK